MGNYCRYHFINRRGLKLDKKSINPTALSDAFSVIDKVLLQQGSMTIHNQSSCHNYATHVPKKQDKKNKCISGQVEGQRGKKKEVENVKITTCATPSMSYITEGQVTVV